MIDRKALLTDLKKQVGTLEGDLRERAADDADTHARLYGEWQQARTASRIAATYESWLEDRVTQVAVAWVLGTVFLRFCEDNGLIEMPFLAGPGERLDLAQERQAEHIRKQPHDTDRHWILAGFTEMSRSSVAAGLFDEAHNPMWQIEIPHHAAKALLAFWRRRDENGEIVHDFTDPEWDTRFLGDLYQDLSEHAKKTYALLQTPEFVEEFILDYTLEPAVDEFGLAGLRLIDPTCGSGHFLLGAFHRILNKWRDAEPATDIWDLIRRTLLSVHGVDKNPFATNIARFRLLVAVMKVGGVSTLARVPEFPIIVATGDSLLHGRGAPGIQEDLLSEAEPHTYSTENIYEFISREDESHANAIDLLGRGSYHVVVGNPPYINARDKSENENYRKAYQSCYREYSLAVPFLERFFQLAKRGGRELGVPGFVGQITANSFMRREFGKRVVEEFLPRVGLTHVIDTSGAYISDHGTDTVILIGRRVDPNSSTPVRAVLGTRREPGTPDDPRQGRVWTSIVSYLGSPEHDDEWISVRDLKRELLAKHPWSLGGGGAADLVELLKSRSSRTVGSIADCGFHVIIGEDDAFFVSDNRATKSHGFRLAKLAPGTSLRDWRTKITVSAVNPYNDSWDLDKGKDGAAALAFLWPTRLVLAERKVFGVSIKSRGEAWHKWREVYVERLKATPIIAYGEIATHNHFALSEGDVIFTRTSPVIKLKGDASRERYAELIGLLNSSSACFYLRQTCTLKGGSGIGRGIQDEQWEQRYQFNVRNIASMPIPSRVPVALGEGLCSRASAVSSLLDFGAVDDAESKAAYLERAEARYDQLQGEMVFLQEELDWAVYGSYGLLSVREASGLVFSGDATPALKCGERAFEILMARKMALGQLDTQWFKRHGSTPVTEIPEHWPEEYKKIVAKRIEIIESRRDIALVERPEYKRRWVADPWEKQEKVALRSWLLDRCVARSLWFADDEYGTEQPRAVTVSQLADQLRRDEDFMVVARLYAGDDVELAKVIAEVTQDEHVPYLAALRYKDPFGLRKRVQWEDVWKQQREEDRTGKRLDIPVPPKYTSADFLKTSYWRNRGKLDVPKERFISYPGSGSDGDSSMLLGWAGWDHREQAQALMMLIEERAAQDGWDAARLTPLLAGLAEVLPWVRQWHGEVDPAFGQSPADAYAMYLEDKQRTYGISDDDLRNWRAEKPKRGGRRKQTS